MEQTDLLDTFDELARATAEFNQLLKSQQPQCWLPLTDNEKQQHITPIEKACELFEDIWYVDGQDGRETRSCHGVIAGNTQIIEAAKTVNKQKEQLHKQIKTLQKEDKKSWKTTQQEMLQRHPGTKERLHWAGLDRLHLKQLYRQIPIIENPPEKVGFSWYTSGRSIKKITPEDAQILLEKFNYQDTHIKMQLEAVAKLKADTPLAQVQQLAPIMRANLVFEHNGKVSRKALNASLPLLINSSDGQLPIYNPQSLTPPEQRIRLERSDQRLETEVFLPSIRVFKYQR